MRISVIWLALVVLALPGSAGAQQPAGEPPIRPTAKNTFVYDHLNLRRWGSEASSGVPAPHVLSVRDGDYFQVIVRRTDPRVFTYSIAADETVKPRLASTGALPESIATLATGETAVTMRHDRHFGKYRVAIRLRSDLLPSASREPVAPGGVTLGSGEKLLAPGGDGGVRTDVLYGIEFDLWVMTAPEWTVGFSGGFAFSGLTDPKFFIKTDASGAKTFEQDDAAQDDVRRDVVALANLYYTRQFLNTLRFGLAFGIGDAGGSSPRYVLGPSVTVGNGFMFSVGPTFGSVRTLPLGQELQKTPISSDNTLNNLGSKFKTGWSASIGFMFINRESEFKGAFSSNSEASKPAPANPAPGAGLIGKYTGDGDKKEITVELTRGKDGKDGPPLRVTLDKRTFDFEGELTATEFKNQQDTVKFTVTAGKPTRLEYVLGGAKGTATKQP
jgi:hypothetical protein